LLELRDQIVTVVERYVISGAGSGEKRNTDQKEEIAIG
jgi:hypothetical protein